MPDPKKPKKKAAAQGGSPQTVKAALIDLFVNGGKDRDRIVSSTPITGNAFMGYSGGRLDNIIDDINERFSTMNKAITTGDIATNNSVGDLADMIESRGGKP